MKTDSMATLVKKSQNGCNASLLALMHKFTPLLKKYAFLLNQEDGYNDFLLFFIEMIRKESHTPLAEMDDAKIVKYIEVCVRNEYRRLVRKKIKEKRVIPYDFSREETINTILFSLIQEDKTTCTFLADYESVLSKKEYEILFQLFVKELAVHEVAALCKVSRQTISSIKNHAFKKIVKHINSDKRL